MASPPSQVPQDETSSQAKLLIDLPVLEAVRACQTKHGLDYDSYLRYRGYCSRRLHRLRRSLNVHQGVATSAKARHQRARKLIDITNSMVLEAGEKKQEYGERMLVIPLFLAERAWAYAMEMKQEIEQHPRKRFHLVRRLRRAAEHAQRFEKLVYDDESPCTERTKEEATAYAGYMTGLYQIERQDWAGAHESLSKSLSNYFKLAVSVKRDDVAEHYRQRIDGLRTSLRYCAFNLGDNAPKKAPPKVKLPAKVQFHDLAFRHVQQLKAEESQKATETSAKGAAAAATRHVAMVVEETSASPKKATPSKKEESQKQAGEDDDDDEFQETREGIEDEDEEQTDEETDDEDKPSGGGGVTSLVKGWLGGAWS